MSIDERVYDRIGDQSRLDRRSMRLREIAYQAVKDSILNGILGPEAPLVEERIAAVLKISRTPVREALAILEHEGLIEPVPYKGLFVKAITVEDFLSMYQAVEVIEAALARAAVEHIQPDDLVALEKCLVKAQQSIPDDIPGHLNACRSFQRRLGECARNPYLTAMLVKIEERSDLYLLSTRQSLPAEKMLAAVADRYTILDAIRTGDPDAATRAAQAHARAIRVRWREMYVEAQS
jgi:DNA-binding GntR family transcriptional regulator